MPNWLLEIVFVILNSNKILWAFALGPIFFFGIQILGIYMISDFEMHGPMAFLTDSLKEKMFHRYDRIAWTVLIGFWGNAIRLYLKDKNKYW